MARRAAFIDRFLYAAQMHGENSDSPEHEVGDLQMVAWKLWAMLTPAQKKRLEDDEDLNGVIVTWVDE